MVVFFFFAKTCTYMYIYVYLYVIIANHVSLISVLYKKINYGA